MTTEERVKLAMLVAEGFSSDIRKIQEIQLDMQQRVEELFSTLNSTKIEDGEQNG